MIGRNDTTYDFEFIPVTEMFEKQAAIQAEKTAVISSAEKLTYRELNAKANRIAHALVKLGAGPEKPVMIFLPRNIDVYPVTWGILKSGSAFVVANTSYPDERVLFMTEDSGSSIVISSREVMSERTQLKQDLGERLVYFEDLLGCEEEDDLKLSVSESQLCYCIYTSGSTGRPKGVMLEHGNLTNFVYPSPLNTEAMGLLERGSVMLAMAPMTFDVSIMEEFLALTSGMTLAQASDEEIRDPDAMKHFLLENRVDAACMTPAYLNTLASIPDLAPALKQLKVVDLGAEAFPGALYTRLHAINPDLYIMNGYGPTEATISCTVQIVTDADHITIGRPNANVYAYIIDEQANELPDGEEGELLICGKGVGRGYRNLPEKTAAAFITFRGMKGYRTGDRALIDANGEIEFHGRNDNQVKLRGLRIELGEVEEVISRHPAVKQTAAMAVDNRYLVAYYTLQAPLDKETLRDFAKESLAHYMVPDIFMELETMPMTPNLKIDRKALPRPVLETGKTVPPENDMQEQILNILREVITDLPESTTESILDYGLSSLDAMILMARLEETFSVSFRIADIFDHPTVRQMEEYILHAPKRMKSEEVDRAPLNTAQRRRYEIYRKDPEASGWTMASLIKADRSVCAQALCQAVTKAVGSHPVLLCTLEENEGQVYMKLADKNAVYVPQIIRLSEDEMEEVRTHAQPVFDLRDGVMFRAVIYETQTDTYLHLMADHLILDGDSMEILESDIDRALRAEELPKERMSFTELCAQQANLPEDKAAVRWFQDLLAGMKNDCGLHCGTPDPSGENMDFLYLPFDEKTVNELCSEMRVSLTALFCGILGLCLAAQNHSDRAAFELSFNGRSDSRLENTVGYLVQNIPVCCRIEAETFAGDYLRNLQDQLLRSMSYAAQAPAMVKKLLPECEKHLVICQKTESDTMTLGGKEAQRIDISGQSTGMPEGVDTIFTLNPVSWGMMLAAMYDPARYGKEHINGVSSRFHRILSGIHKEMTLKELLTL